MYKKIVISILMFIFLIMSCGNSKLNDEEKKIVNEAKTEVKELKKNPSKEKAQELFKKGGIQNEKKNYEIAKIYYEGVSEFVPMANYYLAILYRKRGNEKKYIEYIKKASDKGVLNASKDISRYYQQKGEFDKSIDYRMKVVEQGDETWSDFIILDYVIGRKENKLKGNEREKIIKFFEKEGERNYKVREWFANFYRIEGSYEEAEKIYPIEIKMSASPNKEMAKNFSVLKRKIDKEIGTGIIICQYDNKVYLSEDILVLPVEYI